MQRAVLRLRSGQSLTGSFHARTVRDFRNFTLCRKMIDNLTEFCEDGDARPLDLLRIRVLVYNGSFGAASEFKVSRSRLTIAERGSLRRSLRDY